MKREKFVSTKELDLPKIKKQRYEIRKSLGEGYTGKLQAKVFQKSKVDHEEQTQWDEYDQSE